MKGSALLFFCLLCSMPVWANLSGTDDFNDNAMDASKWSVFLGDSLNETNSRLEFASAAEPESIGVWEWILNDAGYVQDWSISLDAFNSIDEDGLSDQSISFGILAFYNDPGVYFDVNLQIGDDVTGGNPYRIISTEVESSTGPGIDYGIPVSSLGAGLKISFDAASKNFTGYYDIGDGLTMTTNFNTGAWGMSDSDVFTVVIYGLSSDLAVSSGEVFGDNFTAIPEPGTLGLLAAAAAGLLLPRCRKR